MAEEADRNEFNMSFSRFDTDTECESGGRDEVLEVRKQSQKETTQVRNWRILVTFALIVTAVAVTVTTYVLLVEQEDKNFRNVYKQFARSVGEAAIDQQSNLRDALRSFKDMVALTATVAGNGSSPWPYFVFPTYETLAIDFKKIANAEFISINNLVKHDQRDSYIDFITPLYQTFVKEGHMVAYGDLGNLNNDTSLYQPYIAQKLKNGSFVPDIERDHYFCRTTQSPPARKYGPTINNNLIANKIIGDGFAAVMALGDESVLTSIKPFVNLPDDEHEKMHSNGIEGANNPHSFTFSPIHRVSGDPSSDIVAMFALATAWDVSMLNLLPSNVKGMICVLANTCNQTVTYRIDGKDALYLGEGDLHEHYDDYDDMVVSVDLNLQTHPDARSTPGHCMYSMNIYPSKAFEDDYKTNTPAIFATIVAGTFLLVAIVYFIYDVTVQRRNEMMIENAAKSNAVVSSFVPDHLRDRLIQDTADQQVLNMNGKHGNLKSFLNDGKQIGVIPGIPLADLFLETTICFADVSGFTAWSSVREPSQVFVLLETIFQAFDRVAKKRRVFKVETVGDCYVAVCGLPEKRSDHALAMSHFARDILSKMRSLAKELEVTLGPDTGDLDLRIGLHSGPVTAGVLRGERPRFQLFGDTMNVCARLESSGKKGRIHISRETAKHITKAGKEDWLEKRVDVQELKGLGTMETFWLLVKGERANSVASAYSEGLLDLDAGANYGPKILGLEDKTYRLIDWNVEMLLGIAKQIADKRMCSTSKSKSKPMRHITNRTSPKSASITIAATPLEEVKEIITLPDFDKSAQLKKFDPETIEIPSDVVAQLHHLVSIIATMYNNNPFHNFDHASHVVMSVIKILSRVVQSDSEKGAASLHDNTYGITSDPLTQFACAFSALIHDVDHVGVSNAQLVLEGDVLAARYSDRSVAEQNSLDLSWDLLMKEEYRALRAFLFPTNACLVRFRQLVVNSVMSTDIVDKQLKDLRNNRWDKAFKADKSDEDPSDAINRKATIVIEHIIQASDISHTMQHWHVYRKWNQNLFEELYVAHLNGRMDKDPASFWYKGEFGFFDFYIIPLTQKLKDCGVFGVSSGEYLDYATKNRAQWEAEGEVVVAGMIKEVRQKYGVKGDGKTGKVKPSASALDGAKPEQIPMLEQSPVSPVPQMPKQETKVWC